MLTGKVALITGGGRGIGRATALVMARLGAAVLVNDAGVAVTGDEPSPAPAREVAAEIQAAGGRAAADAESVATWEGAARIVAHCLDAFGRIDILVNNAGIYNPDLFPSLTEARVARMFSVHLNGTFGCTHAALPHFLRQGSGRIINLSSLAGLGGIPGLADYGTAKAGIMGFTFVLARELSGSGVTVNAVAPGAATRMSGSAAPPVVRAKMAEWGFGGRTGRREPEDVAAVIAYLASDQAAGITGRILSITGETLGVWSQPAVQHTVVHPGGWQPETVAAYLPDLLDRAGPFR